MEDGKKYRLPSEAEWEYACRAGSDKVYCFGNEADQIGKYMWYDRNSGGKTHPVGQKKPNTWGLYDMHGNVAEWCADAWHKDYTDAPTDGNIWESEKDVSQRVIRGGAWNSNDRKCRSASRLSNRASSRNYSVGFRVVTRLTPIPVTE